MPKKKPITWPVLADDAEILAVDPSLHSSGWVQMRCDRSVIDCGTIASKKYTHVDAVAEMARLVWAWYIQQQSTVNPALLVIEEQFNHSSGRQSGNLRTAQASGVWIGIVKSQFAIPVIEAYPATWSSFMKLSQKTKEKKKAMTDAARAKYKWLTWSEDAADALGIGLWACHHLQEARQ